jgi:hypothetical protein
MRAEASIAECLSNIDGVRVTTDEIESDFGSAFADSPEPAEDAELLEGDRLIGKPVPAFTTSSFTHFADGAQMSRTAFYEHGLPGKFAYLNAAVVARIDREVLDIVFEAVSRGIFTPGGDAAQALEGAGICPVHEVAIEPGEGMAAAAVRVANAVSAERSRLEHNVCSRWLEAGLPGRLLVDGGIGNLTGIPLPEPGALVGLVKSHRKQYFTRATAESVLGLGEGERTSVFLATSYRGQRSPTHSWYLRLRNDERKSPAFGLVRVELLPHAHSVEMADEISASILAERTPLSLPDMRYDRLIYPIYAVEKILKAGHPSSKAIRAIIGA